MPVSRRRSLFVSKKEWVRDQLLSRLRKLEPAVVNDAALRLLAERAAGRLVRSGMAYGAMGEAVQSAGRLFQTLGEIERGKTRKLITAAELKRMDEAGKLPKVFPWL